MFKLAIVFLFVAVAVNAQDMNEICKKGLKVYYDNEEVSQKESEATQELNAKNNVLYSTQRDLKKGFNEKELARIKEDINNLKQSIADYERYVAEYKAKLAGKNELIELSKLSEDEQNKKLGEINKEIDVIRSKLSEIRKPFREERRKNENSISGDEKVFEEFFKKQFKTSTKLGIDKVSCSPGLASAFSSVSWYKGDKQVLWAHIRMRNLPEIPKNSKMLFNKYYASSLSDNSIWYWAGHFQIAFVSSDKSFKNENKLKEAIKELINSEVLAAVKAQ